MSLASAFARIMGGGKTLESLGTSVAWAMRDMPAPGVRPEGADALDTRFDAEPAFEQVGDALWGYCIVDGAAAVLSCETASECVEVPAQLGGCPVRIVAPRAFADMRMLHEVQLPSGVEELCAYAFMFSGLCRFNAPSGLKTIGNRAFYSCLGLCEVVLNKGLELIGRDAFGMTAIDRLAVPASVVEIAPGAFSHTRISYVQGLCTLSIEEGSPYFLDGRGGLYEHTDLGLALSSLLDECCSRYSVLEETQVIAPHACAGNAALQGVALPEGLRYIGEGAFSGCSRLCEVELPDSLERIGPSAFKNCRIRRITLPPKLAEIGFDAFVNTERALHVPPYIAHIEVAAGNKTFYVEDEMLCMRDSTGMGDALLLYFGRGGVVAIPERVGVIGPAAFAGQRTITRLIMHDHINYIDTLGLFFEDAPAQIVFLGAAPDGSDVEVVFPAGAAGTSAVHASFQDGFVDPAKAVRSADQAVFGAQSSQEAYLLMGSRLASPLWLTDQAAELFVSTLAQSMDKALRTYAEHNYLEGFDVLVERGVLTADNFDHAMEVVAEAGEALAANKLLDLRRTKLAMQTFDFGL